MSGDVSTYLITMQILHLLGSLPWLLVVGAGGLICLFRLPTQPRESWLVALSIGLSLFATFGVSNVINLLFMWVPGVAINSAWMATLFYAVPHSLLESASWGLLLYAAFGEGSGPRTKYLKE